MKIIMVGTLESNDKLNSKLRLKLKLKLHLSLAKISFDDQNELQILLEGGQ